MTKKEQYIIDFPLEASYREADFVVSESNLESYNFLRDPNLWNNCCLVLTGEEGAGKTHLSHIWSEWFSAQKLSPLDLTLDETKTYFIVERQNRDESNHIKICNSIWPFPAYAI